MPLGNAIFKSLAMKKLKGILPAIVTPTNAGGIFQEGPFEKLLSFVYEKGVDGLYVCGQTGEGLQQSVRQRKLVTEAAVRFSPRSKTIMAHVGAANTADAVELARHAEDAGAHALSALPPIGNYSFTEVKSYYQTLAEATSLPFFVYYFPSLSASIGSAAQILELCAIPNVAGLKFTDSDFFKMSVVCNSGATLFNGFDEMLVAGMLMGASGGIGSTYNVMPELFVQLYAQASAADWVAARQTQATINELIEILLRYPVNPAVKQMLVWMGHDCGPAIAPRRSLTAEECVWLGKSLLAGSHAWRFPYLPKV